MTLATRVKGYGALFDKLTGERLDTVKYALAYLPRTTDTGDHFTRMHVEIGWDAASKALDHNSLLTLKTTAGYVDLLVCRATKTPERVILRVMMKGDLRETLD